MRAGYIQSQLAFGGGLGFWAALKSSVAVTKGEVAGETVYAITHTDTKAYALLESGVIQFKPGEILGPAPLFIKDGVISLSKTRGSTLLNHSEKIGIPFLQSLGATEGRTGTFPMGCRNCIEWMVENASRFIHENPKPK